MRNLLVITNSYPGVGSTERVFIHSEIVALANAGVAVTLAPVRWQAAFSEDVPAGVRVDTRLSEQFSIFSLFRLVVFAVLDQWVIREILNKPILILRYRFWKEAIRMQGARRFARSVAGKFDAYYTFWFTADTVGLAREGCRPLLTRAHGYDLYEETRENASYVPFRRRAIHSIDRLVTLSNQAAQYSVKYGILPSNVRVIPLGVPQRESVPRDQLPDITGVSCAFASPTKRLDSILRIFVRLAQRQSPRRVTWHHLGASREEISKEEPIPDNLTIIAHGKVANEKIVEFYRNNAVSFFINFSVSEGQPVSIMEAMSFGIPVIAPRVGGVEELVSDGGLLVSVTATEDEVCDAIEELVTRNEDGALSLKALEQQRANFDAAANAEQIARELNSLRTVESRPTPREMP